MNSGPGNDHLYGEFGSYFELLSGKINVEEFNSISDASSSAMVQSDSQPCDSNLNSSLAAVQNICMREYSENSNDDDDPDYVCSEEDDSESENVVGNDDIEVGVGNQHVPMAPFFNKSGNDHYVNEESRRETAIYPGSWNPEHEDSFVGLFFKSQELMKKGIKLWSIKRNVNYVTVYSNKKSWDICCKKYEDSSCQWRLRSHFKKKLDL